MGISMQDSKLDDFARLISAWPGLMAKPDRALIDDSLVLLEHLGVARNLVDVGACATLRLENVEVVARRAEEAGHDPALREKFDVAVARALAPLPVLVELCLPLVRVGGRLLAQKTTDEDPGTATDAITLLGGELSEVLAAPSEARATGTVVVIDKVRPGPAQYPRRPGVPARKPLS